MALIQAFKGKVSKMELQKLLFLFSEKQSKKCFDFVPYKYGCFSFQANADLNTMIKYELIKADDKNWLNNSDHNYLNELKEDDRLLLNLIRMKFGNLSPDELIKHTYLKYPYYALNSKMAERLLNRTQLNEVQKLRNKETSTILFTIGYEGISLEKYLNILINNNVKLLVDVRKNSKSMKYGFSKNQLSNSCNGVGIDFFHIPDLGIVSNKRQELNCQNDYDILFAEYKRTVLQDEVESLNLLLSKIEKYKRVALTCFEKDINQCHRLHLSNKLSALRDIKVKHI